MPVRSKAQLRWLFWAESVGKLPKGTAKRWLKHTKNKSKLPERVKNKKKEKKSEFQQEFNLSKIDNLFLINHLLPSSKTR